MPDVLRLTGLSYQTRHGVHPHEKKSSQPFVVDVALWCDTSAAGRTDALTDTVDYTQATAHVTEVMMGEPVNLVETLAERIAARLLATYLLTRVEVTVHKPAADVGSPVSDVSVTIVRERP